MEIAKRFGGKIKFIGQSIVTLDATAGLTSLPLPVVWQIEHQCIILGEVPHEKCDFEDRQRSYEDAGDSLIYEIVPFQNPVQRLLDYHMLDHLQLPWRVEVIQAACHLLWAVAFCPHAEHRLLLRPMDLLLFGVDEVGKIMALIGSG